MRPSGSSQRGSPQSCHDPLFINDFIPLLHDFLLKFQTSTGPEAEVAGVIKLEVVILRVGSETFFLTCRH